MASKKPNESSAAAQGEPTVDQSGLVVIPAELALKADTVRRIGESVEGDGTNAHKVVCVAIGNLEAMAAGAVLLPAIMVKQITEAAGKDLDAADITQFAEAGAGRRLGRLAIMLEIDPVWEPTLKEIAAFQGQTVAEVLNASMNEAWDNGWFYADKAHTVSRILMSEGDKLALEKVLGATFDNGSQLARLVRELAGDALFDTPAEPEPIPILDGSGFVRRSRTQQEWDSLSKEEQKRLIDEDKKGAAA